MTKRKDEADDPVIPFRMSHAEAIVRVDAKVDMLGRVLMFMGSAGVTLLAAIFTVLLVGGR
jgi:hypothetical protein